MIHSSSELLRQRRAFPVLNKAKAFHRTHEHRATAVDLHLTQTDECLEKLVSFTLSAQIYPFVSFFSSLSMSSLSGCVEVN